MINVEEIKERVRPIAEQYHINRLALFGSYARQQAHQTSDIDLLVDIPNKKFSLLDFVKLKLEIERALETRVDLVEYQTIKPRIREKILSEQIVLL